ncbi:MAG TPA: hypothetical protein VFQ42_08945 [Mycobacterium sp.]|nr:hypothetical protein [Mycobacterium sp.]
MKRILLHVDDDEEARWLLDDMAEYPDSPLHTPVADREVYATVVGAGPYAALGVFLDWLAENPRHLAQFERDQPELAARLRRIFGGVSNSITGPVGGAVLQAGVVRGDLHFRS